MRNWKPAGTVTARKPSSTPAAALKFWLPGITDVHTLEVASKLSGQVASQEKGQEHHSRHEIMTADMIRQLPPRCALVIRGGLRPVVARLPMAWKDKAYKKAKRGGWAVYQAFPPR